MLGMLLQDGRFIIRDMYGIHGRLITNNDGLHGHSRGCIYIYICHTMQDGFEPWEYSFGWEGSDRYWDDINCAYKHLAGNGVSGKGP